MGSLMQLVAYGAQDVYLSSSSNITYFPTTYNRHTNFSSEPDIPLYTSYRRTAGIYGGYDKLFVYYGFDLKKYKYSKVDEYIKLENEIKENTIKLCHLKFKVDMQKLKIYKSINKLIDEDLLDDEGKYICPVLLFEININDLYIKCNKCNKCFSYEVKEQWIDKHNNCPHCRHKWSNNDIYQNTDEDYKNKILSENEKIKIKELREERKQYNLLRKYQKRCKNNLKNIKEKYVKLYSDKLSELIKIYKKDYHRERELLKLKQDNNINDKEFEELEELMVKLNDIENTEVN
jgi:hypothetical protein